MQLDGQFDRCPAAVEWLVVGQSCQIGETVTT